MTGLSDRGDARAGSGRPAVRRLAWVVAGSVVIGPLAAVVLTAGVFAGAPEHVVTGTGLLGLALGWAALAFGSAALTDRPQRWAAVPGPTCVRAFRRSRSMPDGPCAEERGRTGNGPAIDSPAAQRRAHRRAGSATATWSRSWGGPCAGGA
jgi:hypothetical protein